jgi:uncharacterized membrane protein YoaK (UPF0700 family)
MSGNVVLLGFAAAGVSGLSSIRALLSLAGFLIGTALGGKLGTMVAGGRRRRLIIVAGTFEGFLIFAAAVALIGFDLQASASVEQLYAMIVLTSLSMGLRNATIRQFHVADITTTVLTLTLTGLAADSSVASGSNPRRTAVLFDSCTLSRCALWCLSVAVWSSIAALRQRRLRAPYHGGLCRHCRDRFAAAFKQQVLGEL